MTREPDFIVFSDEIELNGVHRFGIHVGYILAVMKKETDPKPIATIGNDFPVDIVWQNEEQGICFLDTFTKANVCLRSTVPMKVTVLRMLPIEMK